MSEPNIEVVWHRHPEVENGTLVPSADESYGYHCQLCQHARESVLEVWLDGDNVMNFCEPCATALRDRFATRLAEEPEPDGAAIPHKRSHHTG